MICLDSQIVVPMLKEAEITPVTTSSQLARIARSIHEPHEIAHGIAAWIRGK